MQNMPMPNSAIRSPLSTQEAVQYLIAEANGLVNLARRGERGLDGRALSAQRQVLQALALQGPQTVPVLAKNRTTSRQNIQIVVNKLSQLKLVETVPNPAHRRSKLIQLTPAGRQFLDQVEEKVFLPVDHSELSLEELCAALRTLRILRGQWLRAAREASRIGNETRVGAIAQPDPASSPASTTADSGGGLPVNLL
jgi:DNA-binding MarR family transcriptional regulator